MKVRMLKKFGSIVILILGILQLFNSLDIINISELIGRDIHIFPIEIPSNNKGFLDYGLFFSGVIMIIAGLYNFKNAK